MLRVIMVLLIFSYSLCVQSQSLTYLAISTQAEPFQIIDQAHKGIVTDILEQAITDLDISVTEQAYPFMRYIRMMQSDKTPLWISYGSPAWQGDSEVNIQSRHLSKENLFNVSHVLVVKAQRPINLYSIEALFGKTVITLNGFNYPGLDEYFASGEITKVEVKSHESALKAVENSRGVAFIAMKTRALYTINKAKLDRNDFTFLDFSSIIPPYPIHFSYSELVAEETKQQIDQAISALKYSGEINKIIDFYQGN
ncbi:ABC transporter substrate-binding protein [Shewanella sp. UCD-KL12]|uniref:substrate-binding periplasmic protein n=1 Tax=Shewanella sp. UCD-KL12 TaxID=1917163 RepID=UPI0009F9250C|nr:transporter substrate-binding domain-containing protein [Shewanella sp. UCD-KL12]